MKSAADRVRRFIEDWGTAWDKVRRTVDRDPLGALDRWDAAMRTVDERHFVAGTSSGADGAFSRVQADHHHHTERVLVVTADGDGASVRTEGPHPTRRAMRAQYLYELAKAPGGWRIAAIRQVGAVPSTSSPSDSAPIASMTLPSAGPDYGSIDIEAARTLHRDGKLAKLLLLPQTSGGIDAADNVVFVPPFVVELKRTIDSNARASGYTAKPEYRGDSAVPIAIHIQAGPITADINIWGDALERTQDPP